MYTARITYQPAKNRPRCNTENRGFVGVGDGCSYPHGTSIIHDARNAGRISPLLPGIAVAWFRRSSPREVTGTMLVSLSFGVRAADAAQYAGFMDSLCATQ